MTIVKEIYRNRNDFVSVFECDQCGYEKEAWVYVDGFFYGPVMSNASCPQCRRILKVRMKKS